MTLKTKKSHESSCPLKSLTNLQIATDVLRNDSLPRAFELLWKCSTRSLICTLRSTSDLLWKHSRMSLGAFDLPRQMALPSSRRPLICSSFSLISSRVSVELNLVDSSSLRPLISCSKETRSEQQQQTLLTPGLLASSFKQAARAVKTSYSPVA